jgi:hypothetical protein
MTGSPFKAVKHCLQRSDYNHATEEIKHLDLAIQDSTEELHTWAFISEKRVDWEALDEFGKGFQRTDLKDPGG